MDMEKRDVFRQADEVLSNVERAITTGNYRNLSNQVGQAAKGIIQNQFGRRNFENQPKIVLKGKGGAGVQTVLGIVGLVCLTPFLILLLTATFTLPSFTRIVTVFFDLILLVLGGLCAFLTANGVRHSWDLNQAQKYYRFLSMKGINSINTLELGEFTSRKEHQVQKDLRRMIDKKIFPQGHLVRGDKLFLLDHEAFQLYREEEEKKKQQIKAEQERKKNLKDDSAASHLSKAQREQWLNFLTQGEAYNREIEILRKGITNTRMSAHLDRFLRLLQEIFDHLRVNPEKTQELRRFIEYYLPTTKKLLEKYREFEQVSVPGAEITEAMGEIEKTLDTLNLASVELLNSLFQDDVFDITADAEVLRSMLAKDSLVKEEMLQRS